MKNRWQRFKSWPDAYLNGIVVRYQERFETQPNVARRKGFKYRLFRDVSPVRLGANTTRWEKKCENNHLLCNVNVARYGKLPVSRRNAQCVTVYHPIASFLAHTCVYLVYRKSICVTCFQNNIFYPQRWVLKGQQLALTIIINLYYWKSM